MKNCFILIFLFPILIFSNILIEKKDIFWVESFFLENDSKFIDSLEDKDLQDILYRVLIVDFLKKNDLDKIVKLKYNKKEKVLNQLLKNESDTNRLGFFIKNGLEITNYTTMLKRASYDKEFLIKFVREFPQDSNSIKFFKANPEIFSHDDSVFVFLKNFSSKNFDELIDRKDTTGWIIFLLSLKGNDTLKIKNYINIYTDIFSKVEDKKIKSEYVRFVEENRLKGNLLYFLGKYYENKKDYKKAALIYFKINDDEALLRIVSNARNENDLNFYDSIMKNYNGKDKNFLYHQAKYYYMMGDRKKGDSLLNIVVLDFPLTLYSVRAFIQLNKKLEIKEEKFEDDSLILKLYKIFEDNGFRENFKDFLVLKYRKDDSNKDYIIYLLNKFKFYNFSTYFSERRIRDGNDYRKYICYLFPVPYLETFRKISNEENVDLSLLLSIAREESNFNWSAISPSNAKGIMQLMDFVYDSYNNDKDYFNLEKNIRAGAKHLKDYLSRFPDSPSEAIMAYNAGVGNVKKWKRKYADWELFIEGIPFIETKNYVKRVLRTFYFYKFVFKVS
ncbi:MAG: lytic transglycosylase domain-containing protein [candidate division WOR-3 bacterium]